MKTTLALCLCGAALVATAAPAHAGHGTDLLKFAPEASQMVIVFDVADARDSSLLQKGYAALLAAKPDAKAKMAAIGIDPMKDIDTVMIAGGSADSLDMDKVKNMVVVVEGRLPKDKLASLPDVKTSTYQGVTIYASKDSEAAMIDNRLFFAKSGQLKGEIDVVLGKGAGKGHNVAASKKAKALRDAIAATDTTADMWATVLVPAKSQSNAQMPGVVAKTVSFGVNLTADLAIALKVGTNSAAAAKKAVETFQGQLVQVTQMMGQFGLSAAAKSILVVNEGVYLKMGVTVSEAEINTIMGMAKGMMGGAGGSTSPAKPATH
ncbi:MAG: hypothetical protein K8W52_13475 [Deltaproteobacteria bacterium]|nr:hypothetical protein [Deltaproteobacteria bacterium]